MRGGLSYLEYEGWAAMDRLGKASEKHTVAKLPCCGSSIEITDPSIDNFVVCPNKNCRKRAVVLSGLSHQIKQEDSRGPTGLSYR